MEGFKKIKNFFVERMSYPANYDENLHVSSKRSVTLSLPDGESFDASNSVLIHGGKVLKAECSVEKTTSVKDENGEPILQVTSTRFKYNPDDKTMEDREAVKQTSKCMTENLRKF